MLCATSTKEVCRHSSINSFTLTPQERGDAGIHESVFALPKGGKRDALVAGRLGRKAERARLSLDPGLGIHRESLLLSLLGLTYRQPIRRECASHDTPAYLA